MDSTGALSGERLVRDVVRDVAARVAPDEVVLVEGLCVLDDVAAVRRLSGRDKQDPLGFGLAEAAALVTPVVWLVLNQMASTLAGAAAAGAARRSSRWLRRVLRRPSPPAVLPPLGRDQLAEVHQRVLAEAVRRGSAAEDARELADAVVAALVLAAADPPPSDPPEGEDPTAGAPQ
ncbi:hypothetical protein ACIRBX_33865 [Kitasatospora sp. NPDC096147]|uniref:hypothetical protein n=1 Tax=Kitasatospora sp. NPDC096147 TaxID=3364093 RepID=UPI00382330F0